jgi:hypothetical protein
MGRRCRAGLVAPRGSANLRAVTTTRALGGSRELLLSLGVLFVLGYAWMPTAGVSSPNERSRIYLAMSLVDQHTVAIDVPVRRFGSIFDMAQWSGHFLTDKAPGSSILAAAVYGTCRLFRPASAFSIEELLTLMRRSIMLPVGVLGFLLFRRLARQLEMPETVIHFVSLAWILGSAAAHASAGLVGHQMVSVCLLAALLLIFRVEQQLEERDPQARLWPQCLGAGLIAGFSVLTEYQSAIPFGLLALYTLAGPLRRRWTLSLWLVLGTLPGALGLLLYNKLAFGGFFEVSYRHLVNPGLQQLHGQGIGGVKLPRLTYAKGALISWHRGLLTTSPFFLLVAPGLVVLWRRGLRRLALLLGACVAYYVLFVCSTEIWFAGWGFGPRLMVPMMGLAALTAGFGLASLRSGWTKGVAAGLCLWGILYTQTANAVFPELPERFTNPLPDILLPALRAGALVPNLATRLFGWHGLPSLVPLVLVLLLLVVPALLRFAAPTTGARERLRIGVAGAITIGALLLLVRLSGPGVAPASTERHIQWMRQLLVDETALWKR